MKSIINELWHGSIIPQEDSRTNSKEMKELLGYMSRHHEDLEKSFTDEQKETFEKFHDCWSEYMSLGEAAIFEYAFKLGATIIGSLITIISRNSCFVQSFIRFSKRLFLCLLRINFCAALIVFLASTFHRA